MMAQTIDNKTGKVTSYVAAFLVGWIACSAWYGTLHLKQAAKVLPVIEAEAGCEHWRADTTTKLALSPNMVDKSQIPKDCAHPVVPKEIIGTK